MYCKQNRPQSMTCADMAARPLVRGVSMLCSGSMCPLNPPGRTSSIVLPSGFSPVVPAKGMEAGEGRIRAAVLGCGARSAERGLSLLQQLARDQSGLSRAKVL